MPIVGERTPFLGKIRDLIYQTSLRKTVDPGLILCFG